MSLLGYDLPSAVDVLVNLTILLGALGALYKFRVFDVMGHRYRSEVWCTSTRAGEEEPGRVLFVGNFVIHNTGSRPLKVTRTRLSLMRPHPEMAIIDSDHATPRSRVGASGPIPALRGSGSGRGRGASSRSGHTSTNRRGR